MDKFDILSFATLTPRDRTANQAIRFVVVQHFRWSDNKTGSVCFFAVGSRAARLDFFPPNCIALGHFCNGWTKVYNQGKSNQVDQLCSEACGIKQNRGLEFSLASLTEPKYKFEWNITKLVYEFVEL